MHIVACCCTFLDGIGVEELKMTCRIAAWASHDHHDCLKDATLEGPRPRTGVLKYIQDMNFGDSADYVIPVICDRIAVYDVQVRPTPEMERHGARAGQNRR